MDAHQTTWIDLIDEPDHARCDHSIAQGELKKAGASGIERSGGRSVGAPAREILDALVQRERLGSTGTGDGIAIPHAKLARAKSMFGIFARMLRPIDFDSLDGAPVDLIFLLVAPESAGADHLKALARLARMLRDPLTTAKLRAARDVNALYSVLNEEPASHAA